MDPIIVLMGKSNFVQNCTCVGKIVLKMKRLYVLRQT
jgi:hypothetical protein